MNIKITRHYTAPNNEPAVEFERVSLWGEVMLGKSLTNGLEGQALIDQIEKDSIIADKFAMSGELVDEPTYGSLAWRMNAEAGTLRNPPRVAEPEESKQPTLSKPPKPKAKVG